MEILLPILLGLVAIICLLGGANILIKGASYFLPKEVSTPVVLDNLLRFLSGIYFSAGFLFIYALFTINSMGNVLYFLGLLVVFSGLGRFYSRLKVGSAGKYFDFIMILEILLGAGIIIMTGLRNISL